MARDRPTVLVADFGVMLVFWGAVEVFAGLHRRAARRPGLAGGAATPTGRSGAI